MTPAENPMLTHSRRVFVRLAKKASKEPIPVESPAKSVSPKAKITVSLSKT
jgi:hypothetical protein